MNLSKRDVERGFHISLQTVLDNLLTKAEKEKKAAGEIVLNPNKEIVLRGECEDGSDAVVYIWNKKTDEKTILEPNKSIPSGYGWETLVIPLSRLSGHLKIDTVKETVYRSRQKTQGRSGPL